MGEVRKIRKTMQEQEDRMKEVCPIRRSRMLRRYIVGRLTTRTLPACPLPSAPEISGACMASFPAPSCARADPLPPHQNNTHVRICHRLSRPWSACSARGAGSSPARCWRTWTCCSPPSPRPTPRRAAAAPPPPATMTMGAWGPRGVCVRSCAMHGAALGHAKGCVDAWRLLYTRAQLWQQVKDTTAP